MSWDFKTKPMLVFWETTRACDLACQHCRASAIAEALPGELTHEEGLRLIDQIHDFGTPSPILIFTGGDVLKRDRIWDLMAYARDRDVKFAMSPSVTPLLTEDAIRRFNDMGAHSMSLSLDASLPAWHDALRGVPGTHARTLKLMDFAVSQGLHVQVNTAVMQWNISDLPNLFQQIHRRGVNVWEVFFLIHEGRGSKMPAPSKEQCESVCRFLVTASGYGITVRTVEAPFFRRLAAEQDRKIEQPVDPLATRLIQDLRDLMGPSTHRERKRSANTRDGLGIVFINYKGEVCPSGFLPVAGGNVKETPLPDIYRDSKLFVELRDGERLQGKCGACPYRELCGGSRARAYAATGNCWAEDPSCTYEVELAQA